MSFASAALAGTTTTVVDEPTSTGAKRVMYVEPDTSVATIVVLAGGSGLLNIGDNGTTSGMEADCNVILRAQDLYLANGYSLAYLNDANQISLELLARIRARRPQPQWLFGISSGTIKAVTFAPMLPIPSPYGLLLLSPAVTDFSGIGAIKLPTYVAYHVADDPMNVQSAITIYDDLVAAPARSLVPFSGGPPGQCGHHTFSGLDSQVAASIDAFIDANNASLSTAPANKVPVVEYFNAGFGHYFMTAQTDEIAGLDAGAFNHAFVRTGLGFNAYDAQAAGAVPVCRFFTTPGRFGTKSSHFYTADAAECEFVKLNPDWQYEKIAFYIQVPTNGACPGGTLPVYRAYNTGMSGAPNHRFTTDVTIYQQFTTQLGWGAEGIKFCSPP